MGVVLIKSSVMSWLAFFWERGGWMDDACNAWMFERENNWIAG